MNRTIVQWFFSLAVALFIFTTLVWRLKLDYKLAPKDSGTFISSYLRGNTQNPTNVLANENKSVFINADVVNVYSSDERSVQISKGSTVNDQTRKESLASSLLENSTGKIEDNVDRRSEDGKVHTHRVGCREYTKGGQSCLFSGISCIDLNEEQTIGVVRPQVFLVDDDKFDKSLVSHDHWCQLRAISSDPRYFANRVWPPSKNLDAPRWSCLNAKWRTFDSLFNSTKENGEKPKVRWVDKLSLVDLDYVSNSHNNHYVKDIVWLLDVSLWQQTFKNSSTSPSTSIVPQLFDDKPDLVFLPQSSSDFEKQTSRDVNKLNFALIMQQNGHDLYKNRSRESDGQLKALPILEAYPSLKKKLLFYQDERSGPNDLICTRKFVVGSKLGDLGHERVCQHLRDKSWELYGVEKLPKAQSGYLKYERPPRRVILLQRHITRGFKNLDALVEGLKNASIVYDFELEVNYTSQIRTAEEQVMFFSRAGVLIAPHGAQNMGGMWMPRHAAMIEIFPPAYNDYAFNLLAGACNLWYFELFGKVPADKIEEHKEKCGEKGKSFYNQCVQMKSMYFDVDVPEAVKTVVHALKKLNHDIRINQQ